MKTLIQHRLVKIGCTLVYSHKWFKRLKLSISSIHGDPVWDGHRSQQTMKPSIVFELLIMQALSVWKVAEEIGIIVILCPAIFARLVSRLLTNDQIKNGVSIA